MAKVPPIEAKEFLSGVKVVDIGDYRVARGLSRRVPSTCAHNNMVYDSKERRIYCPDCENDVEAFDAFEAIVYGYNHALEKLKRFREEVATAYREALHRIAARSLDKTWRSKMLPCCPHCSRGLMPDDMIKPSLVSKEFEAAQRAREGQ